MIKKIKAKKVKNKSVKRIKKSLQVNNSHPKLKMNNSLYKLI